MSNSAPFEVIAAPFTLYVAAVGTAFPAVDAAPGVGWTKVGTSGPLNYDRAEGVTVEHRQSTSPWRSAGDTGSRKNFPTEEDLIVRLKLVDLTPDQYALALNHNAITTVAAGVGVAGTKAIGLSRGSQIVSKALLIRGDVSPIGDQLAMQYEIPIAQQIGSPQVALSKPGEPAGLNLEFMALVDTSASTPSEYFGRLVIQTAAAS